MRELNADAEVYEMLVEEENSVNYRYDMESDSMTLYNTYSVNKTNRTDVRINNYIANLKNDNYVDKVAYDLYVDFLRGNCEAPIRFLGHNFAPELHMGAYLWYEMCGKRGKNDKGEECIVGKISMMDEREGFKSDDEAYKNIDSITGLVYKYYAGKIMSACIKNREPEMNYTLMLLDMDKFTEINDTYGTKFADAVFLEVLDVVFATFKGKYIFSRVGGDEILIFAEGKSVSDLKETAEKFSKRVSQIYSGEDESINVSATIAMADTNDADSYDSLYDYVRCVLSHVKERGGDGVGIYSEVYKEIGKRPEEVYPMRYTSSGVATMRDWRGGSLISYAMTLLEDAVDINSSINMLLSRIGKIYEAERVSVTSVRWDTLDYRYAYEWAAKPELKREKHEKKLAIRDYYKMSVRYDKNGLYINHKENDDDVLGTAIEAAIFSKGKYAGTLCIEYANENHTWVDITRNNISLLANMIGIYISREESEKDLKRKQFEMKVMSIATNGGFKVVHDDRDRTIIDVSEELCALFGYTRDEFLGITDGIEKNMIYPDDLESAYDGAEKSKIHDSEQYTMKYRVRCKDGSLKWVLDSGTRITEADGRTVFYSTCIDITEAEAVSAHIKELYDQAKATERFISIALENSQKADFYYYPSENRGMFPELSCKILGCKSTYTNMPYDFAIDCVEAEMQKEFVETFTSMHGDEETAQCVVKLKDSDTWVKMTLSAVKQEGSSNIVVGIVEDVSNETAEAQERMRIIESVSNVYYAMYHIKIKDDRCIPFKQIEDAGGVLSRVTKYSEFVKEYERKFVAPEFRKEFNRFVSYENARSTLSMDNKMESFEFKRIYPGGRLGWVRMSMVLESMTDGKLDAFILSATDIDEAKQREIERAQEHELLSLAISESYDYIYQIQTDTDVVYEVQQKNGTSVRRRNGKTYDELVEHVYSTMIHEEDKERYLENASIEFLKKTLTDEKPSIYQEYRVLNDSEAGYSWTSYTYRLMPGTNGRAIMLFLNDIDERKRHELEIQEALQSAFDSATAANTAKSDFLSKMSHDIRTPMNAIIGMTAIAQAHMDNKSKVEHCLEKITVSSKHLLDLINEVLDMSKIESGKIDLNEEDVNLSELIDGLITMVRPQIEKRKHKLKVSLNNVEHEDVIGDSLRVQQVFVNLMSNAVKYTPDGGLIELNISELPSKVEDMGLFEFVFKDNGIGMTQEFLEHIFDPFMRAEDSRISKIQGTGLGMAITKNIVSMMNGDIKVKSEPNKGSEFIVTMYFKLRDSDLDNDEFKGKHVLVVDDDVDALEGASELMSSMGIECDAASSCEEAKRIAKQREDEGIHYFTALIDWSMPDCDGIETTKQLKDAVGYKIPMIMISAYDWSAVEDEAKEAGIEGFISKPLFRSRVLRAFEEFAGVSEENENELEALLRTDFSDKRILLVEDNEINMEIATEVLSYTGAEIETAEDGEEAYHKFQASSENYYDIVFMDVQMPKMNGYEATSAIRKLERPDAQTTPIVAMTANTFADDVRDAKNAGMNDHLAKPIDFKKLLSVMNKWLTGENEKIN